MHNSGCYAVRNLELSVSLPSVASGDRVFATVVDALSQNVSITCVFVRRVLVEHYSSCCVLNVMYMCRPRV